MVARWSCILTLLVSCKQKETLPASLPNVPPPVSATVVVDARRAPTVVDLGNGRTLVRHEERREVAPHCTVSRDWPEIAGDRTLAEKLNPSLHAMLVSDEIAPDVCKRASTDQPFFSDRRYTITGRRGDAIGLRFDHVSFTGGAHEVRDLRCHVLDLARARVFELGKDLSPSTRDALSKLANDRFRKEHEQTDLTKAGFFEPSVRVSTDTPICLTDDGVEIVFNPYEIAPWSMGTPSVKISAADLRPIAPELF